MLGHFGTEPLNLMERATAPLMHPPPTCWRSLGWRDRLWRRFAIGLDAMIRVHYGISEFTDHPECVIRVALGEAPWDLRLTDGTEIRVGDRVLVLHFWNEHMLRFHRGRPTLGWASAMRRRASGSLRVLAQQMESEPAWREVRAVRGDTRLFGFWRMSQARRVMGRFGFDFVAPKRCSRLRAIRSFTDDCVVWMLTRAFNPEVSARQEFVRGRDEMWMSRDSLLERYGRAAAVLPDSALVKSAPGPSIPQREEWRSADYMDGEIGGRHRSARSNSVGPLLTPERSSRI